MSSTSYKSPPGGADVFILFYYITLEDATGEIVQLVFFKL